MGTQFDIALLFFLTFCAGFSSSSETSLFSLPAVRLKAFAKDSDPKKQLVAKLLERPKDLIVTIFMLNTLSSILLQNVASSMFGTEASWTLKVGFPLIVTLLFGEIIPKSLGLQHNIKISRFVAPTISRLQNFLTPIRRMVIAVTYPISRTLFFFLKKEETISREELHHVLKTSEELEVLNKDEAELVCGYLDLQEALVKELMRPRQEILFYDINEPLTKLTHLFVDQQCSRIPVCKGNLENILGIVTAKDFFLYRKELTKKESLLEHLSKPFFVPENMLARVLLKRFDEKKLVLALAVDEYGSIAGLITREDLLEVIIGQIKDLRDEKTLFSKQNENEIIASGKLELDEFNAIFSSAIDSENNIVTIGGWIAEHLGEIPKSGKKFEAEGFFFHILAATPNRIRRVYIRQLNPKSSH